MHSLLPPVLTDRASHSRHFQLNQHHVFFLTSLLSIRCDVCVFSLDMLRAWLKKKPSAAESPTSAAAAATSPTRGTHHSGSAVAETERESGGSGPLSSCQGAASAPERPANCNPQPKASCTSTAESERPAATPNDDIGLDATAPSQPINLNFPKRHFGKTTRAFCPGWYRGRPWLEYSVKLDACFCFPCRKFGGINDRDLVFTKTGFTNWKTALEKDKGFTKHAASQCHIKNAKAWSEMTQREATGETISNLLGPAQIEKNRYYIKTIGEIVKFLAVNELPLRGTLESSCVGDGENDFNAGLFLKMVEYTLEKDPKFNEINKSIPPNGKYTSHNIQNEIIDTLAHMVLDDIKKRYNKADSAGLCIKCDGTRDKCNIENLSLMIRFVSDGIPEEHLIGLLDLSELNAEFITEQILKHLSDSGYNADNIISQCYDGASVMSGVRGGVQALLQQKVGKDIPYIHCYNHQLHLAVVHAMQAEPCAKNFFDLSGSLHSFFHRHYVSQNYNVPSLKRLLEIRWTSHHDVTKCLMQNEDAIMKILSEVSEDRAADVDICLDATGLLTLIKRHHFFEIGRFLLKVLGVLKPANNMMQGHSVDLCSATEVVNASLEALKKLRNDESEKTSDTSEPPTKRKRTMSSLLTNSVVMSNVGHSQDMTTTRALKRALLNILDRAIVEMETRFSKSNLDLMEAVNCLLPQSSSFLDFAMLSPLMKMAGVCSDALSNEISVAKIMLEKKFKKTSECDDNVPVNISTICKYLQKYDKLTQPFPELHRIYVTALVIGISSASCESSFSTLSRVLTPFRRTMLHERKRNLVILAHEKAMTNGLNMDEFVRAFAQKSRRLML